MSLPRRILYVLALIVTSVNNSSAIPNEFIGSHLSQAIDSIDKYLDNESYYNLRKQKRIEKIYSEFQKAGESRDSLRAALDLAKEYRRFDVDSSARFYQTALELARSLNDRDKTYDAIFGLCTVNPIRGVIRESLDQFESIDTNKLSKEYLLKYYDTGFDLYLATSAFYPAGELRKQYFDKALECSERLSETLDPQSAHSQYHKGWTALGHGELPEALAEMRMALDNTKFGDELFARIASTLGDYYHHFMSDDDTAAYYLALSAMSDIAAGTRETTSLQRLAMYLYKNGDIDRAYRYLNTSLDNSIDSGSKIRTLSGADSLSIISKAYNDNDTNRIVWLYVLVAILSLALILLVAVLIHNRKSNQRLYYYKHTLTQRNILKNEYIKQILALCSSYIERIEEQNLLIIRKIKAGQAQDLYRMAENGDILKDQNSKFLKAFDEAFMSVYPEFISKLNELLEPKDQFNDVSPQRLSPELRIAAFMKLGVEDSSKIARFLGLSLNTVYTYRNKLKSRAIDRENFERNLSDLCEYT